MNLFLNLKIILYNYLLQWNDQVQNIVLKAPKYCFSS